ncbi:hypothetical protein DFP72DRAFT_853893 [Ephemerocybe angulata]|uniref:Uncharacterized protein n=1 Tax=Ephemerocybe angulata TaxID=980116 RepID=A0A8H6HJ95_9AGAR|nr:hypothetical protein DFP72DRAFT_853893 [Tulosesus angulatus]
MPKPDDVTNQARTAKAMDHLPLGHYQVHPRLHNHSLTRRQHRDLYDHPLPLPRIQQHWDCQALPRLPVDNGRHRELDSARHRPAACTIPSVENTPFVVLNLARRPGEPETAMQSTNSPDTKRTPSTTTINDTHHHHRSCSTTPNAITTTTSCSASVDARTTLSTACPAPPLSACVQRRRAAPPRCQDHLLLASNDARHHDTELPSRATCQPQLPHPIISNTTVVLRAGAGTGSDGAGRGGGAVGAAAASGGRQWNGLPGAIGRGGAKLGDGGLWTGLSSVVEPKNTTLGDGGRWTALSAVEEHEGGWASEGGPGIDGSHSQASWSAREGQGSMDRTPKRRGARGRAGVQCASTPSIVDRMGGPACDVHHSQASENAREVRPAVYVAPSIETFKISRGDARRSRHTGRLELRRGLTTPFTYFITTAASTTNSTDRQANVGSMTADERTHACTATTLTVLSADVAGPARLCRNSLGGLVAILISDPACVWWLVNKLLTRSAWHRWLAGYWPVVIVTDRARGQYAGFWRSSSSSAVLPIPEWSQGHRGQVQCSSGRTPSCL